MHNVGGEEKQKRFFFLLKPNMCTSSYHFCVQGERENVTKNQSCVFYIFSVLAGHLVLLVFCMVP